MRIEYGADAAAAACWRLEIDGPMTSCGGASGDHSIGHVNQEPTSVITSRVFDRAPYLNGILAHATPWSE